MPTTNPTAGDVHVNRPLTDFAQKYMQGNAAFVASRAMPNKEVSKQSDLYYTYNRGDWYRDDMELRADGAESAGSSFKLSTDPYFCDVFALHKDVTDRQRANSDTPIMLDNSASQFLGLKALIKRELKFAESFMGTGKWTTDVSPSTKWDAAAGAPISDVRTGLRTVQLLTGYRPNKAVIGREAFDTLQDNDEILDRISGGATRAQPADVTRELMASLFELEEIFVMDSVYNTAVEGAADVNAFIGGDDMLLYYAPNSIGVDEPTAGSQFSWTGQFGSSNNGSRIKRFRMEALESDRVEIQSAFDFKLTAPDLGYFLNNVTA